MEQLALAQVPCLELPQLSEELGLAAVLEALDHRLTVGRLRGDREEGGGGRAISDSNGSDKLSRHIVAY